MDKELRYGRVEIVESTAARIHVRWKYQSCDFNYKVNGDLPVEDYYFYPDGFGTRVLTLTYIPEAKYELEEFIFLTPQAAVPMAVLPTDIGNIISVKGEKVALRTPVDSRVWSKLGDVPAIYRIRLSKHDPLAAISFNPNLTRRPGVFGPIYDRGQMVSPMYWGNHWPLTRGCTTVWSINDRISLTPSANCIMSWTTKRPKPIRSETVETKDGLGQLKTMKVDTWVWLIGMTDASDESLLQRAQSFTQPPSVELQGARLDFDSYVPERRAIRLVVENSNVPIMIKPAGWCVNPVFELRGAPKELVNVKLGDQALDHKQYAWDSHTLWLNSKLSRPTLLRLEFRGEERQPQ